MSFDHIETLKRAFTDKYVVVDAARPELARFKDAVGQVKTVNMSGRALVEFDQFDNIGWYDIELDFLKVVPKPEPKQAEAKEAPAPKAAKPAAVKPVAAAAKPAVPAASGSPMSTADILAAARAKKGTAPPAAKPTPAAKPAAAPGQKLSTAEILAAARGRAAPTAGAAPAAAAPAKQKPAPEPAAEEEPAEEAVAIASKPAPAKTAAKPAGPLPTTTAEKVEYCRRVDAKA